TAAAKEAVVGQPRYRMWDSLRLPHNCFLWKRLQQKHTLVRPGQPPHLPMLYQLSAALILVCATGTLGHAQAWHERGCHAPPIGRDTFVLARAGRPTLPPSRAALVVFASVRDSTTDTPLNGFA